MQYSKPREVFCIFSLLAHNFEALSGPAHCITFGDSVYYGLIVFKANSVAVGMLHENNK